MALDRFPAVFFTVRLDANVEGENNKEKWITGEAEFFSTGHNSDTRVYVTAV